MNRRSFLKRAGLAGAGTAALAAPAIAQSEPTLRWRLTSSFPKSADAIYGTAETFADFVRGATDGRFQIEVLEAGEIVPGLQAVEAVRGGSVEMCHTASSYAWGKDPTFALATAMPFGLNSRQQNAWNYHGGGIALMNAFYAGYNLYGLPCGNTGAQMGGWFAKEISSPTDLKGLKMRIGGMGGAIMEKLGALPRQMAGGDIYRALEKREIDAAEWIGPYADGKLALHRVAPYYYYPGFWEGGATLHLFINKAKWDALTPDHKALISAGAQAGNADMMARFDAANPAAIRDLVAEGVQLRRFSDKILSAAFEAAHASYDELSARHSSFKKVYESLIAFRKDAYLWTQLAEASFDGFMMAQQRAGKL